MVSTKTVIFYLFLVVFFNFFAGAFSLSSSENDENEELEFDKTLYTNNIKNKILETSIGQNKIIGATVQIIALPFLILESLLFVLSLIGVGFTILPPLIEILLLTPLGLIILLDYVIPTIRGN